jgi:hypothetical protein
MKRTREGRDNSKYPPRVLLGAAVLILAFVAGEVNHEDNQRAIPGKAVKQTHTRIEKGKPVHLSEQGTAAITIDGGKRVTIQRPEIVQFPNIDNDNSSNDGYDYVVVGGAPNHQEGYLTQGENPNGNANSIVVTADGRNESPREAYDHSIVRVLRPAGNLLLVAAGQPDAGDIVGQIVPNP